MFFTDWYRYFTFEGNNTEIIQLHTSASVAASC